MTYLLDFSIFRDKVCALRLFDGFSGVGSAFSLGGGSHARDHHQSAEHHGFHCDQGEIDLRHVRNCKQNKSFKYENEFWIIFKN